VTASENWCGTPWRRIRSELSDGEKAVRTPRVVFKKLGSLGLLGRPSPGNAVAAARRITANNVVLPEEASLAIMRPVC
jgi:hypothetical protein